MSLQHANLVKREQIVSHMHIRVYS